MAKFYIKESASGQYYWILKANNGEVVAKCSEYHPSKATAKKSISFVKANAADSPVVDLTDD